MAFRFLARTVLLWFALLGSVAASAAPLPSPSASPIPLGRASSATPELTLSFEDLAVVAQDLTPGGDAVFFSVARIPRGYYNQVERFRSLELVDSFGEARYSPETDDGSPPLKSVWAVVDLSSGAYAVGAPPGFVLQQVAFPGKAFEVGPPGLVNRLRQRFSFIDMLVVRPGVGAWWLRAHDTGPHDHDGADDDVSTTDLEDLEPLGASPAPPGRFVAGDVLVVIDPRTLRFYATRLLDTPSGNGGGQ